jgi:hypothetical protein
VNKEDKRVGLGLAIAAGLLLSGGAWAKQFLGEDYQATRSCPTSYWTCETRVRGDILLGFGDTQISFEGRARACVQNGAWETSARRGRFTCAASGLVKPASCETVETHCDLPGGRIYEL